MKNAFKTYLSVTKKEWNGLVVLITLIALVLFAPTVYQWIYPYKPVDFKGFYAKAHRLEERDNDSLNHLKLFHFNPNRLLPEQWEKLGLNEDQVELIKNYEAKGGKFNSKQDVEKMYSITPDDYKRLAPYIDLPDKPRAEKSNEIVEVNSADSVKLTHIRGVGGGYAKLIIRYRDRLGGFYRKEQLKEIFGLDSLAYLDISPFIKVDATLIKKTNLNKATLNNLLVFPYLTYKQKSAIVAYREQHGDYNNLQDLKNIPIIEDEILRKIEPYIIFK